MTSTALGYRPVTLLTDGESSPWDPDEEDEEVLYQRQRSNIRSVSWSSSIRNLVLKDGRQPSKSDGVESKRYSSSIPCNSRSQLSRCSDGAKALFRGSDLCWTKSLPATSSVIFFLLFVAFPVHFVELVITGIASTASSFCVSFLCDPSRLLFVCFYSGAILSAILSPLTISLIGFKWTIVCACAGVSVFTLTKCISATSNVLFQLTSTLNGLTVGASLAAFRTRSMGIAEKSSSASKMVTAESKSSQVFRGCTSLFVSMHAAPAVSAILWIALLVPEARYQMATSATHDLGKSLQSINNDVTSIERTTPYAIDNVTWTPSAELRHQAVRCGTEFKPDVTSYTTKSSSFYASDVLLYRIQALIGCYVMCSLGALLLSIGVLEDYSEPSIQDHAADVTSSCFSRRREAQKSVRVDILVLRRLFADVIGQFNDRIRCLSFVVALFLGSQQVFAYYIFLQAFPGCYIDHVTSVLVGTAMATVSLVAAYPVAFLIRLTGRVKLLLLAAAVMTSLMVVILLSESMSRVATIYAVACLWSFCDCCFHLGVNGNTR